MQTQGHGHTENKHLHGLPWMQHKLQHAVRAYFMKLCLLAISKTDNGLKKNTSLLVLAAVKTNTLVIEREVKEKFALSTLNTSG